MGRVGVRELKNRLSEYLRRVAEGEVLLITDHGRVVAELRRPSQPPPGFEESDLPPEFWEKVALGKIRLGEPNRSEDYALPPPLDLPPGTVQSALDWIRGER
ncbi:MAG: type II toxin-antitoxin system prevent-host-death family antitoxin [Armatimonadetes bacterium]|nr:type II toxin-antitoxin system prevent-host-death family antitoxin [Armatimonadota bacterium]